jgi:hypothetical protein
MPARTIKDHDQVLIGVMLGHLGKKNRHLLSAGLMSPLPHPGVESLAVAGTHPSVVISDLVRAGWLLKAITILNGVGKKGAKGRCGFSGFRSASTVPCKCVMHLLLKFNSVFYESFRIVVAQFSAINSFSR